MTGNSTEFTKVRINADGIELEVEGPNVSVPELMKQVAEMRRSLGPMHAAQSGGASSDGIASQSSNSPSASTNTIASQMNAATGSDLVMASMAHITLVQGRDIATRREILDEMKAARTFYRESYSGNFSSYLDSLAKGKRLNLVAKDTYALPNAERQNFERLIASAN